MEITLWGYSDIHLVLLSWDYLQALFLKKYGLGTISLSYSNKETVFAITVAIHVTSFFFNDIETRHVESVKTNKLGHLISLPRDNSSHPTG